MVCCDYCMAEWVETCFTAWMWETIITMIGMSVVVELQVLTSLEPLDYLVVAFLPGISEVESCKTKKLSLHDVYLETGLFLFGSNMGKSSRSFSSVVHCCLYSVLTGWASLQLLHYSGYYTWEVGENTHLQSGIVFIIFMNLLCLSRETDDAGVVITGQLLLGWCMVTPPVCHQV